MKPLTITIQVPDWVEWVTTDKDGAMAVYEYEPLDAVIGWCRGHDLGRFHRLGLLAGRKENWRELKYRIDEYTK